MTTTSVAPSTALRAQFERVRQSLSWAGVTGVFLLVAAFWVLVAAWPQRPWRAERMVQPAPTVVTPVVSPARKVFVGAASTAPSGASAVVGIQPLPTRADIPLIVTQVERAVLANGLSWPAAEFRITPATPQSPTSLDIRFTLTGPYPNLRHILAQLLTTVPGLTLRDLNMTRAASDAVNVEARMALVIFLVDESPMDALAAHGAR